ncbi:U3 small nucleolar RNA-associated protein 25-like protein [Aphelenchoides besseyi]|nr:U3 small nucleolar RNA-associated protein 25-like protein [Aphelenchoides besseyi]
MEFQTKTTKKEWTFFHEHFCQNLDSNFVKKLNLELGGDTTKLKLNAIDKHAAQFTGNGFDVDVYCVHVLNHILRTRSLIIKNQKLIAKAGPSLTDEFIDSTRDQGIQ